MYARTRTRPNTNTHGYLPSLPFPSLSFPPSRSLTLRPSLTNFLLSLKEKSRLLGPWALAPPRQCGGRLCPARATPPPF